MAATAPSTATRLRVRSEPPVDVRVEVRVAPSDVLALGCREVDVPDDAVLEDDLSVGRDVRVRGRLVRATRIYLEHGPDCDGRVGPPDVAEPIVDARAVVGLANHHLGDDDLDVVAPGRRDRRRVERRRGRPPVAASAQAAGERRQDRPAEGHDEPASGDRSAHRGRHTTTGVWVLGRSTVARHVRLDSSTVP